MLNGVLSGGRGYLQAKSEAAVYSNTARFEEVCPAAESSFGVYSYDRPFFERGWHYHPEAELTLIEESSGRRFVGDQIDGFGPGDLVLLGPNLPHAWRNETVPLPRGERARSIYVHFNTRWLEALAALIPELGEIRKLLGRATRGIRFTGPERDVAAARLKQLRSLSGLRRVTLFLEVLQSLAEARAGEALSSPGFAPVLDKSSGDRIRRIHRYVYENFESGIRHPDLARTVGLSPAALSKFFHRVTGHTITEFVNEVRIGKAARLLIDTDKNVSEIAYASGFDSLAHFNATFRRLKQVPPMQFRKLFSPAWNWLQSPRARHASGSFRRRL